MRERNVHLPLAEIPEEVEIAEVAVLLQVAAPVSLEPERAAVPTLPHEVRTDAREAPGVPARTPSRQRSDG
jgi:hypothetical protein